LLLRTALLFVRSAVRLVYTELPGPVAVCLPKQALREPGDRVQGGDRIVEHRRVQRAPPAPVARDLRAIISSLQNVADVEGMSALALHVANITRRRHPMHAVPEEVTGTRRDGATRRAVGKQRPGSGAIR
jgi:thiamine pyrophosphate-dependent acetolactate synthase large subunit-like protein